MNITIIGLGYIGSVTAACLAEEGHRVIGVDRDPVKIEMINAGQAPVIEEYLETIIRRNVEAGRLSALADAGTAIRASEISLICVGTPDHANGSIDMRHIERVCQEIGTVLRDQDRYHLVVLRSTVLPGTVFNTVIPLLERFSGKTSGGGFGIAVNPEFLRESSAVRDFHHPPKTVIGALTPRDADQVAALYKHIDAPVFKTDIRVAEMIKYCDNAFHALKVVFGNEIGLICKILGIDSHAVMRIFCRDHKLNLSAAYLMPGFAFGGSCLPKDIKAITYMAKHKDLHLPLLNSLIPSNQTLIDRAVERILAHGQRRIGFLGLAFKAGTDDLRNSPIIALIEQLIGKGMDIRVFDHHVNLARLRGANKKFIEERIPHISALMTEQITAVLDHARVLVIGNRNPAFSDIFPRLSKEQHVLDLVRIREDVETAATYEGICW